MRFHLLLILVACLVTDSKAQTATRYKENKTVTYAEALTFYKQAAAKNNSCRLLEYGMTDCGKPLQLFVISQRKDFSPASIRKNNELILLVNNGIHAGEPDGIDASIEFVNKYLNGKFKIPAGVVIAIIPVYNIDGSLTRSCCTRANQDGPEEYGFRANGRYLDLNRDFIKTDSRNALAFTKLYREWDPDVFVDTHVSNGADYQYTMTLIASMEDKLPASVSKVMKDSLLPSLYSSMKQRGEEMIPYVNVWGTSPDKGYEGFDDSPRFASGYSAQSGAFPFVTEAHMLKPFPRRVEATLTFLECITKLSGEKMLAILKAREDARKQVISQSEFPLSWKLDSSVVSELLFKGYEAIYPVSNVTGLPQLHYDQKKPFSKTLPYYNHFVTDVVVKKPGAYIIPQAWKEVIEKMQLNGVQMQQLKSDTTMEVSQYLITDYQTVSKPYEGRYLHSKVKVASQKRSRKYLKGDFIIYTNQPLNRYIVETLEPQAPDSWFAWGFFDAVLQYKEGISDYVWEPQAEKILAADPTLKAEFEAKKKSDPEFAKNAYVMLNWVYRHSDWSEPDGFVYPVGRVE